MNNKQLRAIFSGIMLATGVCLLSHTYLEERGTASAANFSPMFYPKIILWLWVILAAGMLIQAIFLLRKQNPEAINWVPLCCAVITIGLFCWLMPIVGFLPVCLVFMVSYSFCLGYRRPARLFIVSILFTLGIWYVFNNVLSIPLPETAFLEGIL